MGCAGIGNADQCKTSQCLKLVHDDAFEAQITLHMVAPLLTSAPEALQPDYLRKCAIFLRRLLTRYLAIVLCRLLDRPNETGRTGITASISSLLEMAESDGVLDGEQVRKFTADLESIKLNAAEGQYDLVQALRDLRNIQVAHTLIPWKDPAEQVWAHDLTGFTTEVVALVIEIEKALSEATGETLPNIRTNADAFQASSDRFWQRAFVVSGQSGASI
jgi:hypothetical protein